MTTEDSFSQVERLFAPLERKSSGLVVSIALFVVGAGGTLWVGSLMNQPLLIESVEGDAPAPAETEKATTQTLPEENGER